MVKRYFWTTSLYFYPIFLYPIYFSDRRHYIVSVMDIMFTCLKIWKLNLWIIWNVSKALWSFVSITQIEFMLPIEILYTWQKSYGLVNLRGMWIFSLLWRKGQHKFSCRSVSNNSFHATSLFPHPLKTSKSQRFSNILRRCKKKRPEWNGLMQSPNCLEITAISKGVE